MSDYGVFWTLFKQHFSCINLLSINYFPTLTLHYRYLLFFILFYFYRTIPLFLSCNFIFVYIDVWNIVNLISKQYYILLLFWNGEEKSCNNNKNNQWSHFRCGSRRTFRRCTVHLLWALNFSRTGKLTALSLAQYLWSCAIERGPLLLSDTS